VIRNNGRRHEKSLRSAAGPGTEVQVVECPDEEAEADYVVGEIARKMRERHERPGAFAILFRTRSSARLRVRLRQEKIPTSWWAG